MTLLEDLTTLADRWQGHFHQEQLRALIATHSSPLSEVQAHTLTCIASGRSFDSIVADYDSPLPTVKWRIQRIHRIYGTSSSSVAVIAALRAGHITLEDIDTKWEGSEATTREVQAMQAVADYGTNKAAAAALGWVDTQVKGFLQRAQDKAHAANRVDLVVRAYREGWVR